MKSCCGHWWPALCSLWCFLMRDRRLLAVRTSCLPVIASSSHSDAEGGDDGGAGCKVHDPVGGSPLPNSPLLHHLNPTPPPPNHPTPPPPWEENCLACVWKCGELTARQEQMGNGCSSTVWMSTLPLLESKCDLIQTSCERRTLPLRVPLHAPSPPPRAALPPRSQAEFPPVIFTWKEGDTKFISQVNTIYPLAHYHDSWLNIKLQTWIH